MQPIEKQDALASFSAWRNAVARGVLLAILAGALLWGSRIYQTDYPIDAEVEYQYNDIPHPSELLRVVAHITDHKQKRLAHVTFFHHRPPRTETTTVSRKQRLRLLRGSHTLTVALHYRDGRTLRFTKALLWEQSGGRHLVRLASAR
ncbi:hypothetical protein L6R29_12970 [Myxococcota bacterium]|nr:hypothetical protein [Myxococcota bacterium]